MHNMSRGRKDQIRNFGQSYAIWINVNLKKKHQAQNDEDKALIKNLYSECCVALVYCRRQYELIRYK